MTRKILFITTPTAFVFLQSLTPFSHSPIQLIMDRQDQRKRAFSQAFQRMNQPRIDDSLSQAAKRTLSYPLGSTTPYPSDINQENEAMLNLDCGLALEAIPGTQIRHNPPANLQQLNPGTYNCASFRYQLYDTILEQELRHGTRVMPPPMMHSQSFEGPVHYKPAFPSTQFVPGKPTLSLSPHTRPDSSSSSDDTVGACDSCPQSGCGSAIYENESFSMTYSTTAIDALTPSALNFGGLSLDGQGYSLHSYPVRDVHYSHRATVRIVPASSFARYKFYTCNSTKSLIKSQYVFDNQSQRGYHLVQQM